MLKTLKGGDWSRGTFFNIGLVFIRNSGIISNGGKEEII